MANDIQLKNHKKDVVIDSADTSLSVTSEDILLFDKLLEELNRNVEGGLGEFLLEQTGPNLFKYEWESRDGTRRWKQTIRIDPTQRNNPRLTFDVPEMWKVQEIRNRQQLTQHVLRMINLRKVTRISCAWV